MNGTAKVAIVMESTARKLWPGQDPVGKTFTTGDPAASIQIVGIARDAHSSSLGELDPVFFYFPLSAEQQLPLKLLVHSNASFEQTAALLRATVKGIDPNVLAEVKSMEQNLQMYRTPARIVTELASVLGAFALFLATIGIYSVVSYAVSRRIREIGIRMTLGAGRREVMRLILSGAMRPVIVGVALGVAAAAAISQVLASVLYGLSPIDPIAFVGVTLFLVAIALLASFIPARRAMRIDPMDALRYE
jgi:ABC-type antimicrobial peptide transport system permease subunit